MSSMPMLPAKLDYQYMVSSRGKLRNPEGASMNPLRKVNRPKPLKKVLFTGANVVFGIIRMSIKAVINTALIIFLAGTIPAHDSQIPGAKTVAYLPWCTIS